MNDQMRSKLMSLFESAISVAHPKSCLPPFLPAPPEDGRLIILSAGKAAAAMVQAAEDHYAEKNLLDRISGFAVTRHGYILPTRVIELTEAGHPVPDDASYQAAIKTLNMAANATENDLVMVLLSGGASALWSAPVEGVSLADKQQLSRQLLASGAPIDEMNCVRKHLSRIKGGRLARAVAPAKLFTLAISDVPGDDPAIIGSGPTIADPSRLEEAREIIEKYNISLAPALAEALLRPENETLKPDDMSLQHAHYQLIAKPADSLAVAAEKAQALGYEPVLLGDALEGEARDLAKRQAELALTAKANGKRVALLSGGEVTVTLRGTGRGGPNQEYVLALAVALEGADGIWALAGDTDGTDGGKGEASDPAGAFIDPTTIDRASAQNLNPVAFLENNDSGGFFAALGDLITPGPTQTNVNDFRVILVNS